MEVSSKHSSLLTPQYQAQCEESTGVNLRHDPVSLELNLWLSKWRLTNLTVSQPLIIAALLVCHIYCSLI